MRLAAPLVVLAPTDAGGVGEVAFLSEGAGAFVPSFGWSEGCQILVASGIWELIGVCGSRERSQGEVKRGRKSREGRANVGLNEAPGAGVGRDPWLGQQT